MAMNDMRAGGLALAMLAATAGAATAETAGDAARRMGRGVNILGYDGVWKGETDAPFHAGDFALIRKAGFEHVRLNFFGLGFMDAQGRVDRAVLERLDRVIDAATRAGLTPVLDQHDNKLCQETPPKCAAPLRAFWSSDRGALRGNPPRSRLRNSQRARRRDVARSVERHAARGARLRSAPTTRRASSSSRRSTPATPATSKNWSCRRTTARSSSPFTITSR